MLFPRDRRRGRVPTLRSLLDARDAGSVDTDVLERALTTRDASQIDIELRGEPVEPVG